VERRFDSAVLPAAGAGRRIRDQPYSVILPKHLLPVAGRPAIFYPLALIRSLGISKIYVVVAPGDSLTERIVTNQSDPSVIFRFIEQPVPDGLGSAILRVERLVNEPFLALLPDEITFVEGLEGMMYPIEAHDALAVECVVSDRDPGRVSATCGVDAGQDGRVTRVVEKPHQPDFQYRGIGIYALAPGFFDVLKSARGSGSRELGLTEGLSAAAGLHRMFAHFTDAANVNINTPEDRDRAERLVYDRRGWAAPVRNADRSPR
jgi:glucose-1-phosphate thymidylyltransferase